VANRSVLGPKPLSAKPTRVMVGDLAIDRLSMNDAVRWVVSNLQQRRTGSPMLIMASNAQLITLAAADQRFSMAVRSADLNIPDGISVVLAARLLGSHIPERVTGGDLMERLCAEAARHGFSVFFLGGLPGAAATSASRLTFRYPGLRVAGYCCPDYGFEKDLAGSAEVRRQIAAAAPDLLCVALGAPKQEIWMQENCPTLPVCAAISVGAALDTTAGLRRRAPRWTHCIGMEWLYRLIREPRRLWRRYLIGNVRFVVLVARQAVHEFLSPRDIAGGHHQ
jgi:N-acetylglucosaminyldiphosphoundecaprenol N-acetyl-beta-D-mannosaminyltransferase